MAQRIIGLDVGSWSIKAVALESSLRRSQLVEHREHHIPTDPRGGAMEGGVEAAIAATLRGLDTDALIAAVPGDWVLTRELTLPFTVDKRIQTVLGFQLEGLLPRSLDEMVYDYQVLRTSEEGGDLLCPAVDRGRLEGWLATLKAGGADPRVLTTTTLAAEQVLPHLDLDTEGRTAALVDIGHRTTNIAVVRDGRVEAIRTINRGGHQLTVALMEGLGVDYGQAEHLKHTAVRFDGHLPPGADEVEHAKHARLVARALEPLLREIRMTLHAHGERLDQRVEEVALYGGTSLLPGVADVLAQVLGAPVRLARPRGPLWERLDADDHVMAVGVSAAALALRQVVDSATHRVNFRQGTLAYESDFRAYRSKFVWIGVFVALLLAIAFGRMFFQIKVLEGQEAQLVAQLDTFSERLLGETFDAPAPQRFTQVRNRVESPSLSVAQTLYPSMTAFKAFFAVTDILEGFNESAEAAEDGTKKQIELSAVSVDVRPADNKAATVTGVAFDVVVIEGFRRELERHTCFTRAQQQGGTTNVTFGKRQGWREFTLKVDIRCPRPGEGAGEVTADGAAEERD